MKSALLAERVFRAFLETCGLIAHTGEVILGGLLIAASYFLNWLWLMPVGVLGVIIGLYRFWTALIRWKREARARRRA